MSSASAAEMIATALMPPAADAGRLNVWADYVADAEEQSPAASMQHGSSGYPDGYPSDRSQWTEMKKTAYAQLVAAPFAAQWSWEGGNGKFYAFPDDANTEIEAQYYERQLDVDGDLEGVAAEVFSGGSLYKVNFEDFTQENTATGRTRKVARELVTAQWYWSGRAGEKHYTFAENVNQFLEAAFQTWRFCNGSALFSLPIARDTYHIDLEHLTQVNCSTGRTRGIKRVLAGSEEANVNVERNTWSNEQRDEERPRNASQGGCWQLTLKVTGEACQCRRLLCAIPSRASGGAAAMAAIQSAVESGFSDHFAEGAPYSLFYQDEDGDQCLLLADTWKDCARHSRGDVLKLTLVPGASKSNLSAASTRASSLRDASEPGPAGAVCDPSDLMGDVDAAEPDAGEELDDEEDESVWAIV